MPVFYPEDTESKQNTDTTEDQHPVRDGTANIDCSDDDRIPRIKGLIELLNPCLGDKSNLKR